VLKIGYRGANRFWPRYERGHYRVIIKRPEYGYVILQKKSSSSVNTNAG